MKRILCSDRLPERARWAQLTCSGFPAFVPQEKILLLTKLVRSSCLDINLVLFCVVIDLEFVSVHKNAKKKLVNNTCILTIPAWQIVVRKIFMANFYYDFRFLINKLIMLTGNHHFIWLNPLNMTRISVQDGFVSKVTQVVWWLLNVHLKTNVTHTQPAG